MDTLSKGRDDSRSSWHKFEGFVDTSNSFRHLRFSYLTGRRQPHTVDICGFASWCPRTTFRCSALPFFSLLRNSSTLSFSPFTCIKTDYRISASVLVCGRSNRTLPWSKNQSHASNDCSSSFPLLKRRLPPSASADEQGYSFWFCRGIRHG